MDVKDRCPDWVFSTGTNVHVARDRSWFTSYTPFQTTLFTPTGGILAVEGIGTVQLKVRKPLKGSGRKHHALFTLDTVLHAPNATCNILGISFPLGYTVDFHDRTLNDENGLVVACFEPGAKLMILKLSGGQAGPSVLKPDVSYYISARWPESEVARWEAFSQKSGASSTGDPHGIGSHELPYNADEKRWLKVNYRGEYYFLRSHGLSIYKEKDREEGRRIVRAMIGNDEEMESGERASMEDDANDEDEDEDEDEESDDDGDIWNAEYGSADYMFSAEELDWIKEHYQNTMQFLFMHGLKFYDDNDVEEGRAIVRALMQ